MQALDRLNAQFQGLHVTPSKPAESTPLASQVAGVRDFAYLVSKGITDATGFLTSGSETFCCDVTQETVEKVRHFFQAERRLGKDFDTLEKLKGHIQVKIPQQYFVDVRLGGEELFCMIGLPHITNELRKIFKVDDLETAMTKGVLKGLAERCQRQPRSLTLRFTVSPSFVLAGLEGFATDLRQELMQELMREPHSTTVHELFKGPDFIGFGLTCEFSGQMQRVQILFSAQIDGCFATGDALQLVLGSTARLLDLEQGQQWTLDTTYQLVRVKDTRQKMQPKMLFRYAALGYLPQGNELDIFKNRLPINAPSEELALLVDKLHRDHPESQTLCLQDIFEVACVLNQIERGDDILPFIDSLIRKMHLRFDKLQDGIWLSTLQLLETRAVTFDECEALLQFFGVVLGFPTSSATGQMIMTWCSKSAGTVHRMRYFPEKAQEVFQRRFRELVELPLFVRWLSQLTELVLTNPELPNPELNGSSPDAATLDYMVLLFSMAQGSTRELVCHFVPRVRQVGSFFKHLLALGMNRLFLQQAVRFPETLLNGEIESEQLPETWVETLLRSANSTMQQYGLELLLEGDYPVAFKRKWITPFLNSHTDLALRLVRQIEGDITAEQVKGWLKGITQRALLIERLDPKWYPLCVQFGTQADFASLLRLWKKNAHKVTNWLEVLRVLAKQPDLFSDETFAEVFSRACTCAEVDSYAEFAPLVLYSAAHREQPEFVKKVFDSCPELTMRQRTLLRSSIAEFVAIAQEQNLPGNVVSLLRAYRRCCKDHWSDAIKEGLFWALEGIDFDREQAGWFLELLVEKVVSDRFQPARQLSLVICALRAAPECATSDLQGYVETLCRRLTEEEMGSLRSEVAELYLALGTASIRADFFQGLQVREQVHEQDSDLTKARAALKEERYSELVKILSRGVLSLQFCEHAVERMHRQGVDSSKLFRLLELYQSDRQELWGALFQTTKKSIDRRPFLTGALLWLKLKNRPEAQIRKMFHQSLLKELLDHLLLRLDRANILLAHRLFQTLSPTAENRVSSAWRLFQEVHLSKKGELFERTCDLVAILEPHLQGYLMGAYKTDPKRTMQIMRSFIQACWYHSAHKATMGALVSFVGGLSTLEKEEIDALLIEELSPFSTLEPFEAIATALQRAIRRVVLSTNELPYEKKLHRMLKFLLAQAPPKMLVNCYGPFFLHPRLRPTQVCPIGVEVRDAISSIPGFDRHMHLLATWYTRFLHESFKSTDQDVGRVALEIDLSITWYQNPRYANQLRRDLQDHSAIIYELFIRQLEIVNWNDPTCNLFEHITHQETCPLMLSRTNNPRMIDPKLVRQEVFETIQVLGAFDHYYQSSLPGLKFEGHIDGAVVNYPIIVISRPYVIRNCDTPLDSELAHTRMVHELLDICLKRVGLPIKKDAKACLLDFVLANLLHMLKYNPQDPELVRQIGALRVAVLPRDELFATHQRAMRGLLREAVRKGVRVSESDQLSALGLSADAVAVQDLKPIQEVLETIQRFKSYPRELSEQELYQLHRKVCTWQYTSATDAYAMRLEVIKGLLSLWKYVPSVFKNVLLLRTFEAILRPDFQFWGVDRDIAGRKHASDVAWVYLSYLENLYIEAVNRENSGESAKKIRQNEITTAIHAMSQVLKFAYQANAFGESQEEFAAFVRRFCSYLIQDACLDDFRGKRFKDEYLALIQCLATKQLNSKMQHVAFSLLLEFLQCVQQSTEINFKIYLQLFIQTQCIKEIPEELMHPLFRLLLSLAKPEPDETELDEKIRSNAIALLRELPYLQKAKDAGLIPKNLLARVLPN